MYSSDKQGSGDLYLRSANGTEAEQLLLKDVPPKTPCDWSPDGRFILYQSFVSLTYWDLWVIPVDGERKPVAFLQSRFEESAGKFSPDGRWVVYQSDESGRQEIYVRPFPSGDGKWQILSNGGEAPLWSGNGKEIYYNQAGGAAMVVDVHAAGTARQLFDIPRSVVYDVTADGKQFLVGKVSGTQATPPVTLVTNWDQGLQKK